MGDLDEDGKADRFPRLLLLESTRVLRVELASLVEANWGMTLRPAAIAVSALLQPPATDDARRSRLEGERDREQIPRCPNEVASK